RSGIHRSHRTDRIQINADITFLSGRGRNGDLRGCGRGFFRAILVAQYQHECERKDEQQHDPYDDPHYFFMPVRFRTVSREGVVRVHEWALVCVNGQKESPFSARIAQIVLLARDSARPKHICEPKGELWMLLRPSL